MPRTQHAHDPPGPGPGCYSPQLLTHKQERKQFFAPAQGAQAHRVVQSTPKLGSGRQQRNPSETRVVALWD